MRAPRPERIVVWVMVVTIGLVGCKKRQEGTGVPERSRVGRADLETIQTQAPDPRPPGEKPPPMTVPPTPVSQPLPVYPQPAIGDEVSCSATLLYHVELDGSARLVRLEWDPAPPDDQLEAFESSVRAAIAEWEFSPAYRLTPRKLDDGSIEPESQPVPYAQRAVVRFRVVDGRGVVE